jgi:hypothetical protein
MKSVSRFTVAVVSVLAFVVTAMAQNAPQPKPMTSLKVQVVIARYEGDKKVSSLPYTMSVTANGDAVRLRMGSQIPLPSTSFQGTGNTTPVTSFTYHNVGTSIDCRATTTDDGRFSVVIGIEDSSVSERRSPGSVPTLTTFSTQNMAVLRDGQTMQFTAAADKTTGEVVKVDVTLTVER